MYVFISFKGVNLFIYFLKNNFFIKKTLKKFYLDLLRVNYTDTFYS